MNIENAEINNQQELKKAKVISILCFVYVIVSSMASGAAIMIILLLIKIFGVSIISEEFIAITMGIGGGCILMTSSVYLFITYGKEYVELLAKNK